MDWFLESEEATLKFVQNVSLLNSQRGAIIGLWAGVETALDHVNAYAWHYSKKTVSKVIPLNLQWKIALFEQIHKKVKPLVPLKPQADGLLDRIKSRLDDRHWMAHGTVIPAESTPDSWLLTKGQFLPDGDFDLLERRFTLDEMWALQADVVKLSLDAIRYSEAVVAQMNQHRLDDNGG